MGQRKEATLTEVKKRLTNPPVLHLPNAEGRFILYSDMSKEGTGSSLWQIQEGKPKLLGYASKTLPEACTQYSATELEMTGLLVNMNLWKNLLKHREFDATVDHVAVTQILKAKTEPTTTKIMRILDRLAACSFNLYYVKGRDMIMADYLSYHRTRDSDTSELIPISFCPITTYHRCLEENAYCIGTRASAKAAGEEAPKVHGADKPFDLNLKPEHQSRSTRATGTQNRTPQQSGPSELPSPTVQPSPTLASSAHHGGARPKDSSTALPPRRVLVPAPPSPFSRGFKPRPL